VQLGAWVVTNSVLQGLSQPLRDGNVHYYPSTVWTDDVVQGRVWVPTGAFGGNLFHVYHDGVQVMDVTDNNFDARPAYTSGGVSVDLWTYTATYVMNTDDIAVRTSAP